MNIVSSIYCVFIIFSLADHCHSIAMLLHIFSSSSLDFKLLFENQFFFFVIPNNQISICMGYACGVLHHKVLMLTTTTKCFISISLAKRVDAWCQQDIQYATAFARTLLNIPYSINYIRFYILCSGFFFLFSSIFTFSWFILKTFTTVFSVHSFF